MMKEPNWQCEKCGLKLRLPATQLESPTFRCLCKRAKPGRRAIPDDGIPCDYRGESFEKINCGCSGTQYTWKCNNPAVEGGLCILRVVPKLPREYKQLPTCNKCDLRQADESRKSILP